MTNTLMTDDELDALLAVTQKPIYDDGFVETMLLHMKKRERLLRLIPFVMGIVGAAITSYFMPSGIFTGWTDGFSTGVSALDIAQDLYTNPLLLALIVCLPIAALQFSSSDV